MKCHCENPTIILNPYAQHLILTHRSYSLGSGHICNLTPSLLSEWSYSFPYSMLSPRRTGVTLDNLDTYLIINQNTGEVFPLYLVVPCGKCTLCSNKKANEWMFRSACENKYSQTPPLFITLTYNNSHLPKNGLVKKDLQLFMKRIRIQLSRAGYDVNLRYMACGEYGSKFGRPHYHLVLWNFPNLPTAQNTLDIVERAWSIAENAFDYDTICPIGFCYVRQCDYGAVSYICKYMRKKQTIPSRYTEPTFFLSSRRNGGIGAQYANEMTAYYRANPEQLDISIYDPYSNRTFTAKIPQYFKRKFFPSLSTLIPKYIRDEYRVYCHHRSIQNYICELLGDRYDYCCMDDSDDCYIHQKYAFLPITVSKFLPFSEKYFMRKYSDEQLLELFRCTSLELRHSFNTLKYFNVEKTLIQSISDASKIHTQTLVNYISTLDDPNIEHDVRLLNERNRLAQLREIL